MACEPVGGNADSHAALDDGQQFFAAELPTRQFRFHGQA
jgi:hypothetical protein